MATKSSALTDPELQARLEEAYQKLVESLDARKNRFFDPSYLAAAQAFATPTKTGSAFEALGNVAGAVGKSQEEEAKRDFDINKSKFDINKELLAISQQRKLQEMEMKTLEGGQPPAGAPPSGAPPAAGALPGPAAPAEGGALTSAVTPQPARGVTAGPLVNEPLGSLPPPSGTLIQGAAEPTPPPAPPPAPPPTPQPPPPLTATQAPPPPAGALAAAAPPPGIMGLSEEGRNIAKLAYARGTPMADAVKKGLDYDAALAKQRNDLEDLRIKREKLVIDQETLDDTKLKTKQGNFREINGALVDISSGTPRMVYQSGGDTITLNGQRYRTDPVTSSNFANAMLSGNTREIDRISAQFTNPASGTRILSIEQEETKKSERERESGVQADVRKAQLVAEEKRQTELIEKRPKFLNQMDNATTAIQILDDKEVQKVLGPNAGPGLKNAIGTLVSGGIKVGQYTVALENFNKALIGLNASKETNVKINALESALRREELLNAQTYLKGEGSVTNMERGLVADIGGKVMEDPAAALLFKVQMTYAMASVNDRYIRSFESWHDKNPTGTIADFNRTNTYKTIRDDYMADLEKIRSQIGAAAPKAPPENKSAAGRLRELVKQNLNKP
jgi:endonuclease YncB( thermonuclease family)